MTTGRAAAQQAWPYSMADEHARRAGIARQMATSFEAAARSTQRMARALLELEPLGYTLLADRRRAGGRRGGVELILVGPGGVVLVETKAWRDLRIVDGRVFHGDDDAMFEIARSADILHQTQGELAEIGLAPGEVHGVIAFAGHSIPRTRIFGLTLLGDADAVTEISRLGRRIGPERVAELRMALEKIFPPYLGGPTALPAGQIPDAGFTLEPAPLTAEQIHAALLEGLRRAPIEEWMAFLHPGQARLVRRTFSGPSRIRGAAGTGKTVVALHRAAHLARTTGGRVLVTTSERTLPAVLKTLLRRLDPDVAERVDFASIHDFALDLLAERDITPEVDPEFASRTFDEVWQAIGIDGPLGAVDPAARYWYEEVTAVIKGRGIERLDDYAVLPRRGRRRPLTGVQRAAVWDLRLAYDERLREAEVADWEDVVLRAEASLREAPLERYRAVIVDEVQDLSLAMLRMVHALVGDRPDGLNLVGDAQQTISPGGYTLAEAGISVRGRSVVLATNYRNTAEIMDFAGVLVQGDEPDDIEEGEEAIDLAEAPRHGPRPAYTVFPSRALHDSSLVERVKSLVAAADRGEGGAELGDIGVLALYEWHAREAAEALEAAGIPTLDLAAYTGTPVEAVKVGTIKRAKGLEFAEVLVVRTPAHLIQPEPGPMDDATAERASLQRRELYVAMTRARDGLWVGVA